MKEKTSQSQVVYKINCKTCNVDYIGKTERILVHRLKELQKKKQTKNKSACYEQIRESNSLNGLRKHPNNWSCK
jgi:hypothetical protein